MIEKYELLKKDLKWQLTFEEIDWDYFKDTVDLAENIQNKIMRDVGWSPSEKAVSVRKQD